MEENLFFSASRYALNGYAYPYFFTGILTLGLAVLIMIREKRSWPTFSFTLLILTAACWLFCYAGITLATDPAAAHAWSRVHATFIVLIPLCVLMFSLSAVKKFKQGLNWVFVAAVLSSCFVLSIWKSPFFVQEPARYFWGFYPRYGLLSFFFLGYFFAVLLASLTLFHHERKNTYSDITRKRMKMFFCAFLVSYFASVDYLPMYGLEIYPFGYLPFFIGLMLLAWGVLYYRLTDITPSYAAEQIIKTMPDGLIVIDRDNKVRVANEKAQGLFAKSGSPLVGSSLSHTGIPFFEKSNIKRLLEVASSHTYEIAFVSPSGENVTVVLSTSVLQSKSGHNIALICIVKDISLRKDAEKTLRERETHYRLLAENATDLVWTMNRDFQFTYISPSVLSLRGYTAEEALKQSLVETFSASSHAAAFQLFSELLAAKTMGTGFESKSLEVEYRCKNGVSLPVELKVSFLPGQNGLPDQILGISKDITELELARKNLEASEKQYRDLIQTLPEPIVTLDHQGCIAYINRAAERLLGYPNDELKGRPITKAGVISDESLNETIQEVRNLILGRNAASFQTQIKCRGGHLLPIGIESRIYRRSRNEFYIELFLRLLSEEERAA